MSITRSRAALCVVDPGTRPARYGRWSDGIFRKYSVRINSEQEAKHGKKKERAPSTPREPVEYSRANSVGRRRRAPATARLRGRRARSVGQAVFTLIIISSRVRHRRPTRGSTRATRCPTIGYTFHATHFNHKNIYRHREFVTIYLCLPARKRSQDELIVPSVNVLVPPRLVCVTSGGAFLHGERNIGVLPDRNTQLARD